MNVKSIAAFTLSAALLCGCDGTDKETIVSVVEKAVDSFFVAFDAVTVTNIALSTTADVTMGYAALDGSGEWRRIFDPSESATAEDALAYIEKTCERCIPSDKAFLTKMYMKEVRLPGAQVGDLEVWHVDGDIFLVVESERGNPTDIALCDFVICDGTALRRLIPFARLPASDMIWDCIRQSRSNPAALNNLAAMLFNDVAMRSAVSAEHINFLLLMAGGAGDPIACRNLAIYYASALATDNDKAYKRDFWLRRTSEAVQEKQQGFRPVLEHRIIAEWPR